MISRSLFPFNNFNNIIHCCTQKTASQWFIKLLSDTIIQKKTGLKNFSFQDYFSDKINKLNEEDYYKFSKDLYSSNHVYHRNLKKKSIASSMYMSLPSARKMVETDRYKAFFILRDPRDIMISTYFSMKHSHPIINDAATNARAVLEKTEFIDGLKWCIDTTVDKSGLFEGQRSWVNAKLDAPRERIFKYEDFANDYLNFMNELIGFLSLPLTNDEKGFLVNKYKFEAFADRKKGETDISSHYRKGTSDQWLEYFTPELKEYFKLKTGDLVEELGYSWDN